MELRGATIVSNARIPGSHLSSGHVQKLMGNIIRMYPALRARLDCCRLTKSYNLGHEMGPGFAKHIASLEGVQIRSLRRACWLQPRASRTIIPKAWVWPSPESYSVPHANAFYQRIPPKSTSSWHWIRIPVMRNITLRSRKPRRLLLMKESSQLLINTASTRWFCQPGRK